MVHLKGGPSVSPAPCHCVLPCSRKSASTAPLPFVPPSGRVTCLSPQEIFLCLFVLMCLYVTLELFNKYLSSKQINIKKIVFNFLLCNNPPLPHQLFHWVILSFIFISSFWKKSERAYNNLTVIVGTGASPRCSCILFNL